MSQPKFSGVGLWGRGGGGVARVGVARGGAARGGGGVLRPEYAKGGAGREAPH